MIEKKIEEFMEMLLDKPIDYIASDTFVSLGFSSINFIKLIIIVEEWYNIELDYSELEKSGFKVEFFMEYVKKKVQERTT